MKTRRSIADRRRGSLVGPLEICEHCGRLIKRRRGVQDKTWERDDQTGTVTMYREVPAEVWVHTLSNSQICRGIEHPNSPWLWAAAPRVRASDS